MMNNNREPSNDEESMQVSLLSNNTHLKGSNEEMSLISSLFSFTFTSASIELLLGNQVNDARFLERNVNDVRVFSSESNFSDITASSNESADAYLEIIQPSTENTAGVTLEAIIEESEELIVVSDDDVQENDVLSGRGGRSNNHPGNISFRGIANDERENYREALVVSDDDVHERDVLSGRGGRSNNHAGNISFRRIVNDERENYRSATSNEERNIIAKSVFDAIQGVGGRFLKCNRTQHTWIEMGMKEALNKIKQAFRSQEEYKIV